MVPQYIETLIWMVIRRGVRRANDRFSSIILMKRLTPFVGNKKSHQYIESIILTIELIVYGPFYSKLSCSKYLQERIFTSIPIINLNVSFWDIIIFLYIYELGLLFFFLFGYNVTILHLNNDKNNFPVTIEFCNIISLYITVQQNGQVRMDLDCLSYQFVVPQITCQNAQDIAQEWCNDRTTYCNRIRPILKKLI